jgi:GMP synthase (glutamine-hydrolysing)
MPAKTEVLVLQHVACETIGSIQDNLAAKNITARVIKTFEHEQVPANLGPASGLVVMGGPMGVYDDDKFPNLSQEKRLIESVVRDEKPVLGICLGSQLLAAALGANVRASGQQEIGWHTVNLTAAGQTDPLWLNIPQSFTALHWHGDIFDLPSDAELLASSAMTAHQAFRFGTAYGLLFHLEVTAESLANMAATFPGDLEKVGLNGDSLMQQAREHLPALRSIGERVFGRWVENVLAAAG